MFCYTSRLKNRKSSKQIICLSPLHTLAALANLSGCQNQPVLSKNHDNSLFFATNKKYRQYLKHFEFDLIRNSIFCCKLHKHFPTWRPRSTSELKNVGNPFLAKTTSLETQNIHIFPFVNLHDLFLRL